MSTIAKITLLFVVFVDLIGQGLVFPIINSLIMEPTGGFLPTSTSDAVRHVDYGLVIGSFFLAWFLGVVYVAKLSDSIGRKNTLLVCLGGAFAGYALTILSLYLNSLWLLILGRAVTGFTAGNQPVAQAAMIDASVDDADRDRNMGYLMIGVSAGLVAGPIIGGVLTDKDIARRRRQPRHAVLRRARAGRRRHWHGAGVLQGHPHGTRALRLSSGRDIREPVARHQASAGAEAHAGLTPASWWRTSRSTSSWTIT